MIGMEASSSKPLGFDDKEERRLKSLLDAFGSSFTIDEIASAYCKAGRNLDLAGEFLSETQQSASSSLSNVEPKEETEHFTRPPPVGPTNPMTHSASCGSVSSIIGRGYARVRRPKNGVCEPTKPMKLDSKDFPESEIWGEDANSNLNSRRNDTVHRNMVEFLYNMLGDGFKLDREVIRDVLDACGYDMPKSVDKLFDMSTEALNKKDKSVCNSSDKFLESSSKVEVASRRETSINLSQCVEDRASNLRHELSAEQKKDLGRTVLVSLFCAERQESFERPERRLNTAKRAGIFGPAVSEPLHDPIVERKKSSVDLEKLAEQVKEAEERFQVTRSACRDYRASTKQCYKYAIEEYLKGNNEKTIKLVELGHTFGELARKADEESNKMILETRNEEKDDAIVLDLHSHNPKGAKRLLESHLLSLSGIPSNLKVIIETDEEDRSKGSRRRKVLELLENESIKWTEEENGGTILIQLACIKRQLLSFA